MSLNRSVDVLIIVTRRKAVVIARRQSGRGVIVIVAVGVAVAIEAQEDGTGVAAQVHLGGARESGQGIRSIVRKRAHGGTHHHPGDQGVVHAVRPEAILSRTRVGANETILGLDRELLLEYSPDAGQGPDLVYAPGQEPEIVQSMHPDLIAIIVDISDNADSLAKEQNKKIFRKN